MELELDRIEEGELQWQKVLDNFYVPFQRRLAEGADRSKEIVRDAVAADAGPCPECSRDLSVRWNRYGRFLGCTGYPECRYTRPIDEQEKKEPKPTGELCPKCGAAMVEREGRFGPFIACSNYPTCKHTQPRTVPGMKCPRCTIGDVGEKRTRRGKPFWGCTRYPECDWSSWDEPVPRRCPNCEAPFLVRKTTKAKGEFMRCLSCAHEYTINADGALDPAGVGKPDKRTFRGGSGGAKKSSGAATATATKSAVKSGAKKAPSKTTKRAAKKTSRKNTKE
jgi:DNA topoisomerase-1